MIARCIVNYNVTNSVLEYVKYNVTQCVNNNVTNYLKINKASECLLVI